ncbi:hypothetical protein, partial [Escherichia coli]|uniref:hypothetical protein n=1 Tax=Escherichia coli TaxID=562 RepID=UPI00200D762D
FLPQMRQLVDLRADGRFTLNTDYFRHDKEGIAQQWENGLPEFSDLFAPAMESLLGPRRRKDEPLGQSHMDLARSAQAMYEEAFFNLLEAARA